jgi:hypothetical protein
MPERERPNLDHVRDAMREHDQHGSEPEPEPPESGDESPESSDEDDEDS